MGKKSFFYPIPSAIYVNVNVFNPESVNNYNDSLLLQCPIPGILGKMEKLVPSSAAHQEDKSTTAPAVKPFKSVPGPKGLPIIGTLLDYTKKDGFRFDKLFEVIFLSQ